MRMMVRLAVIMILAIGLSHGIRISMLDKMAVNFNNLTEIEALEKVLGDERWWNPFTYLFKKIKEKVHENIESIISGIEGPIIGLPPKGVQEWFIKIAAKWLKPDDIGWLVNFVVEFIHDIKFANADERFKNLDDHTKFFHLVLQIQKKATATGEKADAICLPKAKTDLLYSGVAAVQGLYCSKDDEDNMSKWPDHLIHEEILSFVAGIFVALFNDIDKSDEPIYFENDDQVKALLDQHFSNGLVPKPLENFDDFEKDETISNIAFYGFGQNFLRKTEDNAGNGAVYEVDTTILSQIETRSGFEMYGANAFFGEDKKLLQIYVSSMGRIIKPGDAEWKHAKWVWRVSVMTLVSVGTHLSQIHWTVANSAHIAARTQLNENHPIRRVTKAFIYGTGAVNMISTVILAGENNLFHQLTGFTYNGFSNLQSLMYEGFVYETLPDFLASKNLNQDLKEQIPLCTDGLPLWDAYLKFFENYVDFFYTGTNSINEDVQLRDFWTNVNLRGEFESKKPYGLPELNKKSLAEYLAHLAFTVTALHELNGSVVQYGLSPKGMVMKLRPESDQADVQAFVQQLILIGLTSAPQPKLMEDWSHLLPDHQKVKGFYDELKKELGEIIKEIDGANANVPNPERPKICQSFNPKHLEVSVSI